MIIAVNSIIEWVGTQDANKKPILDRILWVSPSGEQCVLILIYAETELPYWVPLKDVEDALLDGRALKRTIDPYAWYASPDKDFLQKHAVKRDIAWEIIKSLVTNEPDIYDESKRGLLIKDASLKHNIHKKSIYKYLHKYWTRGKIINALLPDYQKCGGYGSQRELTEESKKRGRPPKLVIRFPEQNRRNIDEDTKKTIRFAMNKYYINSTVQPTTIGKAYNKMLQSHFNIGFDTKNGVEIPILPPANELPSKAQFKYWGNKSVDLVKLLKAQHGERGFVLKHRDILGESTQMAAGPCSLFQVDATVADVYLVNRLKRDDIIGRPIVYVCIDVFSRLIAGIYVGLEGPSWLGAMIAFANTAESKVDYCSRYDISIVEDDWPCHFLPERLMADRGEFISESSDSIVEGLDINIENTPPYRADWKGIVEQYFRCLNLKGIKWLPGAVRGRQRGERDCRLDAQLDLDQFTKILIHNVIRHNNSQWIEDYPLSADMIADGIKPIPMELWKWGIVNRVGHLQEATIDRVRLALMPKDTARITTQGILFKGLHYVCERALREQWFVRARHFGRTSMEASYDPRSNKFIYLRVREEPIEVCYLLDKDSRYAGCTYEEVIDAQCNKSIAKDTHESARNQAQAVCDANVDAIIGEGAMLSQQVPTTKSNLERTKGVKANRKAERDERREEDAWEPDSAKDTPKPEEMQQPLAESESKPVLSKKAMLFKVLEEQRAISNEETS